MKSKTNKKQTEKDVLVAKIKALNPKFKGTAENSRDFLRAELAKLTAPVKPVAPKAPAKPIKKKADKKGNVLMQKGKGAAATGKPEKGGEKLPATPPVPAPVAPTPSPVPVAAVPMAPPAPRQLTELEKIDAGLTDVDGTPIPPKGPAAKRYESKTDPNSNYHNRERSTIAKPVGLVREICAKYPSLTRKDVIDTCVKAGVNKNTAATQYSLWHTEYLKAQANAGK